MVDVVGKEGCGERLLQNSLKKPRSVIRWILCVLLIKGAVLIHGQLAADGTIVPGWSGQVGSLNVEKRGMTGFLNRHV